MTTAAMTLAALLAIAAVLIVARPFLARLRDGDDVPAENEAELERLHLLEERDRALAALKELEFDHRTGKISDDDYRQTVGGLRAEAASVLSALSATEPAEKGEDVPAPEPHGEEERLSPTPRRSGS
jgi:hypothetical protein